jgi:tetratricopeptide (TPR) repeat protein
LLSVLAEQAQQAGWAAFDAGKHDDARSLYEDSHQAATEAEDAAFAGNALAFLAYQKSDRDHRAGSEIAAQSCRTAGPDAPPSVRALLHERLAWTHALAGNASETERALSVAESSLSEAEPTASPDWAAWVDYTELQIMTGRCWTELRRPLRAVPVLENVLSCYDDTHARDKALYLSWLADSYLAAGEVEQAAAVTGRALELSAGVASVRPRQRLAPVLQQLSAHKNLPLVAETLEKAAMWVQAVASGPVFRSIQHRYASDPATIGTAQISGFSHGWCRNKCTSRSASRSARVLNTICHSSPVPNSPRCQNAEITGPTI